MSGQINRIIKEFEKEYDKELVGFIEKVFHIEDEHLDENDPKLVNKIKNELDKYVNDIFEEKNSK